MAERFRFLAAGSDGLLVELADLETTLTLLDVLQANPPKGVAELVPAARTLMVRFDPRVTDREGLIATIAGADLSERSSRQGELFDIPVTYDGEDLGDVADLLGWSVETLVRRHTEATYTVAFTGFAPGFAYMTADDAAFDVPRRRSPRVRIPSGSVALGGRFGGIYPAESPGGWQLLGRTPLRMWDEDRTRPALLAPGDRVRFRDMAKGASVTIPAFQTQPARSGARLQPAAGLLVTRADRPVLFQDPGRAGKAGQGVSQSGPLDRLSLAEANLCVGNSPGMPVLEIAYGGFALKADRPATLAVTGATAPLTIVTADGRRVKAPFHRPFALDAGDELVLDYPSSGSRSYLAVRGGLAARQVLGSAASDTLSGVGPAPVLSGDRLLPDDAAVRSVDPDRPAPHPLPKAGDEVGIDILFGPRTDWFTERGVATLLDQPWQVTSESNRVGMRLSGAEPLERGILSELPSEGTPLGALQVPPSGQPVLFLADHPLTGGYPVIAVVADHHLDLAGQIPIGATIRFRAIASFDPVLKG